MKKFTAILLLVSFIFIPPAFAKSKKFVNNAGTDSIEVPSINTPESEKGQEVIKGSVSVDIKPYYSNWSTIQAYNKINNIGVNLVDANEIDKYVKFELSDSKSVNASTDLRNTIRVNRGLLRYVETEDELAFVIGHELAHAEMNHVKKGVARKAVLATAGTAGAGSIVTGAIRHSAKATSAGYIIEGVVLVAAIANKKLTRNDETRADLRSIDYMVNAGYNPMASISMLHKLSGGYFDVLSDHPSTDKRIINAYSYINKYYPQYLDKGLDTPAYKSAMNMLKHKTKPSKEYKSPVRNFKPANSKNNKSKQKENTSEEL